MPASDATDLLRPGLLEGTQVLLGGAGGELGAGALTACGALGSRTAAIEGARAADAELQEREIEAALAAQGGGREAAEANVVLVVDCAQLYASAGAGGEGAAGEADGGAALLGAMQAAWGLARAVAGGRMIPLGGGRIVLLAARPGAGAHSSALVAGLENLARTLSIEWARHAVTAVTIAPGEQTRAGEVAALVAFLTSPAGAYFSGCLLDLRGV